MILDKQLNGNWTMFVYLLHIFCLRDSAPRETIWGRVPLPGTLRHADEGKPGLNRQPSG